MKDPAPPPPAAWLRVVGIALVLVGVLLYVMFGLAKGAAMDVGPWSLLAVFVVFGIGALLLARNRDREATRQAYPPNP